MSERLNKEDTETRIRKLAAEQALVPPITVLNQNILIEDLGFDSLDEVEFVMALEDEFSILGIPDEDARKFKTVQDAIDYILANQHLIKS